MKEQVTDYSDDNKKFVNVLFGQNAKNFDMKGNSACICDWA
jgi:hypothetical protein